VFFTQKNALQNKKHKKTQKKRSLLDFRPKTQKNKKKDCAQNTKNTKKQKREKKAPKAVQLKHRLSTSFFGPSDTTK